MCHGPDGQAKDVLRLDSFPEATKDLDGHQAINPDAPAKSSLLARITSTTEPMPPADAEKQLTDAERDLLNRWVQQGGNYETHWAFLAPRKTLPADADPSNKPATIDTFVHRQLKQAGIGFAPEAKPETLARRAALVLTGLPPEPDQLARFLAALDQSSRVPSRECTHERPDRNRFCECESVRHRTPQSPATERELRHQ